MHWALTQGSDTASHSFTSTTQIQLIHWHIYNTDTADSLTHLQHKYNWFTNTSFYHSQTSTSQILTASLLLNCLPLFVVFNCWGCHGINNFITYSNNIICWLKWHWPYTVCTGHWSCSPKPTKTDNYHKAVSALYNNNNNKSIYIAP